MSTFPFTVRATDSEGAFSDRQFSITVRNTRVERFMAISADDAWTSPNGTDWTIRLGQGGTQCAYGNGTWVVLSTTGIRRSTDGINWTFTPLAQVPLTLENNTSGTMPSFNNTAQNTNGPMRFLAGKFYVVQATGNTPAGFYTYQSVDGLTWNRVPVLPTSIGFGSLIAGSTIELSEDNGVIFLNNPYAGNTPAGVNNMGWRSNDNGATWTPVRNIAVSGNQSSVYLARLNNLFFAIRANGQTELQYQYSVDGSNWIAGSVPATAAQYQPRTVFYANGVLYMAARRLAGSTSSSLTVWTSTNGINWTANSVVKPWATGTGYNTQFVYRNGIFLASANLASSANDSTPGNLTTPGPGLRYSNNGTTWSQVLLRDVNNAVVNVPIVDLAWM